MVITFAFGCCAQNTRSFLKSSVFVNNGRGNICVVACVLSSIIVSLYGSSSFASCISMHTG